MQGLQILHAHNVIHRDVKPDNILINSRGEAKMADFGVSAIMSRDQNKRRTLCGTPYYLSPEVVTGEDKGYSYEVDVWSLGNKQKKEEKKKNTKNLNFFLFHIFKGITVIEMCELEPPYFEEQPMKVLYIIPVKPPPTLKTPGSWSNELSEFIAACCVKNPNDRPKPSELMKHKWLQQPQPERQVMFDFIKEQVQLLKNDYSQEFIQKALDEIKREEEAIQLANRPRPDASGTKIKLQQAKKSKSYHVPMPGDLLWLNTEAEIYTLGKVESVKDLSVTLITDEGKTVTEQA